MDCDLLVENASIVDGTGRPAFRGGLAVRDGRILDVHQEGRERGWTAGHTLDASGLTVAPGFIDVHSHAEFLLPLDQHPELLACMLEQGVTTIVGGNCGFSPAPLVAGSPHRDLLAQALEFISSQPLDMSWSDTGSFMDLLERRGLSLNLALLVGHGTMRWSLLGPDYAYPGPAGIAELERILDESFQEGAFGLSLGLGYEPGMFVDMRELEDLARAVRRRDGILTVHLKALSRLSPAYGIGLFGQPHNIRALKEMLGLADRTGVRLQISHLIFAGRRSWSTCDRALELIERAASKGVDVAFDAFPYPCGNTTIRIAFPAWFLKDFENNLARPAAVFRLRLEWELMKRLIGFGMDDMRLLWGGCPEMERYDGRLFSDIGRDMGRSAESAYLEVARASRGRATCLLYTYSADASDETALLKVLAHPLNLFETDAIISPKGAANPAAVGTFPRVIQRCHKELGLMSLEDAVARMTGASARRVGLADRGTVEPGRWADLTLFDYDQIRDNTTDEDTRRPPSGIRYVFVNGRLAVENGRAVPGLRAGRVLRRRSG
ncbi:MAG: amidohydrolase family protein [Proteobacteria bacterium]|nr:amidohydrolase family protein [Pseudomonadota bacterium]